MKRIADAARLQAAVYLKTGRAVMPGLALLVFLVTFYSVGPADLVSSTALTALALFLCMTWAGISFARGEEPVISQLVQLKLGSLLRETASRALVLLAAALVASAFSAAWPLTKNAVSGGTFFIRDVNARDIVGMLLLLVSSSLAGGAYGGLFHSRIVGDTRLAWLLALLGCLAGVFSGVIIRGIPVFAYLSPLFPPVYSLITRFDGSVTFEAAELTKAVAACWIYAAAAFSVKILLLRRIRY